MAATVEHNLDTLSAEKVSFSPSGGLASTDVQGALAELQSAKFAAPGTNVTGSRANTEQALKNLLTALASAGIITDSTTA